MKGHMNCNYDGMGFPVSGFGDDPESVASIRYAPPMAAGAVVGSDPARVMKTGFDSPRPVVSMPIPMPTPSVPVRTPIIGQDFWDKIVPLFKGLDGGTKGPVTPSIPVYRRLPLVDIYGNIAGCDCSLRCDCMGYPQPVYNDWPKLPPLPQPYPPFMNGGPMPLARIAATHGFAQDTGGGWSDFWSGIGSGIRGESGEGVGGGIGSALGGLTAAVVPSLLQNYVYGQRQTPGATTPGINPVSPIRPVSTPYTTGPGGQLNYPASQQPEQSNMMLWAIGGLALIMLMKK